MQICGESHKFEVWEVKVILLNSALKEMRSTVGLGFITLNTCNAEHGIVMKCIKLKTVLILFNLN